MSQNHVLSLTTVYVSIGFVIVLPYIEFISDLTTICEGLTSFFDLSLEIYKSSIT